MIIGTRFRQPSQEEAVPITNLNAGKPVIGFRTATHALLVEINSALVKVPLVLEHLVEKFLENNGLIIMGIKEGARGVVEENKDHEVLNGVGDVCTIRCLWGSPSYGSGYNSFERRGNQDHGSQI